MPRSHDSTSIAPPDTAGVAVRPPLLCLAAILLGAGLHWVVPLPLRPGGLPWTAGAAIVVAAACVFVAAIRTLARADTPVQTSRPTRRLVRGGPYAFSRNPIYVSFALLQTGVALWANNAWMLATLVPAVLVLEYGVIRREERYLTARLGAEYADYARRVRRWI